MTKSDETATMVTCQGIPPALRRPLTMNLPPKPFPQETNALRRWDIFCNVIDNFGDIGVCWRLARQLACEHGAEVRLWVDDLGAFKPLCPELDAGCAVQRVRVSNAAHAASIEVRHWPACFPSVEPGDVVIEAFACRLPESFEAAMAARVPQPVWVNLDYLSAEDWVVGCHALPSPHPRLPLTKHFFFPGFTASTGGLLREHGLSAACAAFGASPAQQEVFWRHLGFAPPAAGTLCVTLFAYENPALPALLDAWAGGDRPLCVLLPRSRPQAGVEAWLGTALPVGHTARRGQLEIRAIPFVSQSEYDRLLWLCEVNFVRGEDSFVRAQWAGSPLVWHIYPQDDAAHRTKLEAFLAHYLAGLSPGAAQAVHDLHAAWNGFAAPATAGAAWHGVLSALPELASHAQTWRKNLQKQEDLCSSLVRFCRSKL